MRYSSPVMCTLWRLRCLVRNTFLTIHAMSLWLEYSQAQWENLLALLHLLHYPPQCHLLSLSALHLMTLTLNLALMLILRTLLIYLLLLLLFPLNLLLNLSLLLLPLLLLLGLILKLLTLLHLPLAPLRLVLLVLLSLMSLVLGALVIPCVNGGWCLTPISMPKNRGTLGTVQGLQNQLLKLTLLLWKLLMLVELSLPQNSFSMPSSLLPLSQGHTMKQ